MFASFLFPFPLRNTPAPYLWIFYKQLTCFRRDEVLFIGSPDYFSQDEHEAEHRPEIGNAVAEALGYEVPSARDIEALLRMEIPTDVFDQLNRSFPAPNHAWRELLTKAYPPLQSALESILAEAVQNHALEGILTWCNCPSLTQAAQKYNLPVIHNELGALRLPHFHPTCYFDLHGVNGKTEAEFRLAKWCDERGGESQELLSREEILALVLKEPNQVFEPSSSFEFEIGLALQVEDDSNMIAFANGFDNYDLITTVRNVFPRDEILIRRHPAGRLHYGEECGALDHSASSLEFLNRCKRVATVNSSVGFEAILFDRPTCIVGDNPFRHLACTSIEELISPRPAQPEKSLLGLNHAIFGYLVPYELLFDSNYYRWRLTNPSESEIVRFHQKFYLSQQKPIPEFEGLERNLGHIIWTTHARRTAMELQQVRNELEQISQQNTQLQTLEGQLRERDEAIRANQEALQSVYQSRSWRMLKPYRAARRWLGNSAARIMRVWNGSAEKRPEAPIEPANASSEDPAPSSLAPVSAARRKHAIERQIAPTVAGIEPGHVARYQLCLKQIPDKATVLDAACGCGYGTWLLRQRASEVVGIDISVDAIEWARQHYVQKGIRYHNADLLDSDWINALEGKQFDAIVSLETLEHFPDPYDYLESMVKLLKPGGLLLVSTPNPVAYPLYVDGQRINPFHFKHWAIDELEILMKQLGFTMKTWFTQIETDFTEQEDLSRGRFLVASFTKSWAQQCNDAA